MNRPLLLLALALSFSSARGASVFWAFQTVPEGGVYRGPSNGTPSGSFVSSSSGFAGTPTLTGFAGTGGGSVSGFAGGVDYTDPNDSSVIWRGGNTAAPGYALNWGASNVNGNNLTGAGMIIGLNTTGLTNLSLRFDVRSAFSGTDGDQGAPTGFSSIEYRTNGGSWTALSTVGPTWSLSTSWQTNIPALDLSAYTELNGQENLELRFIFNGGEKAAPTGITHNLRIDNLVVSAVPEPSSVAMILAGSVMALRRRRIA